MNAAQVRAERLAQIAAMRFWLGAVPLEIAVVPRIGRPDQGRPMRRLLAPDADPSPLLAWCSARQVQAQAQIWIRPVPDAAHPWLFTDDVPIERAMAFAARRAALVIETSPGNCQLRILADRPATTSERTAAQRVLRLHLGGDGGSVSGEKFGRLAGYTNQKSGKTGFWTRLVCVCVCSEPVAQPVSVARLLAKVHAPNAPAPNAPAPALFPRAGGGGVRMLCSAPATAAGGSVEDFHFACDEIRAGTHRQAIVDAITAAAWARGKRRNEPACREYAARTVHNAEVRISGEHY